MKISIHVTNTKAVSNQKLGLLHSAYLINVALINK